MSSLTHAWPGDWGQAEWKRESGLGGEHGADPADREGISAGLTDPGAQRLLPRELAEPGLSLFSKAEEERLRAFRGRVKA